MDKGATQRFGRYEILSEVGRGAMGVVYKARDPRINRVVAVKTISLAGQPPEEDREYRERFFREAEAAGRLSHPGIVTIFDAGEEPETRAPYIVMEYVGGESLEKLLARSDRKLPAGAAIQLTMEIAEALDSAHCMGVVHRDLKPANILLTAEGHAKIADFGVAKLNLAYQTSAGRAWGTPAYMSPEQLNGDVVDGRSDLFSLGVILYTILTGHRPFQGNSALTVSYKVVNRDPIPATLLDTALPPGLDYIITRAMAKDPRERYQRGMEMVLDLQHLQQGKEMWSKTWQQGSLEEANAVQAAKETLRPSSLNHKTVVYESKAKTAAALPMQRTTAEVKKTVIRKLYIGAWVVIAFLVFSLTAISLNRPLSRHPISQLPVIEPVMSISTAPPLVSASSSVPKMPDYATKHARLKTKRSPMPGTPIIPVKLLKSVSDDGKQAIAASHPEPANFAIANRTSSPAFATLGIEIEHTFSAAHLSIWVDDHLAFTRLMSGKDKKTLGVFHHVAGHEFHAVQVSAGKHKLRVQVTAAAGSGGSAYNASSNLDGDFIAAQENMLHITFSKTGTMNLALQ
jgi:serine/threonine-protein kinase